MEFQDEIKRQQELRKANISNSFESVRGTDIEKGKWKVGDIDPKYPNYFVAELKPNGSPVWKSKNKHIGHPALGGKKEESKKENNQDIGGTKALLLAAEAKLSQYQGKKQNSIHPFDPQKKMSDYVDQLKGYVKFYKDKLKELEDNQSSTKEEDKPKKDYKLPTWIGKEEKEEIEKMLDEDSDNLKDTSISVDMPSFGHQPHHMAFAYGNGLMQVKTTAIENAKKFLETVFLFRAQNTPKDKDEDLGSDKFAYKRLTDPNVGAIMHGISKTAKKIYDRLDYNVTKDLYGKNTADRLRMNAMYNNLRRSKIMGSDGFTPVDLSKVTSLIGLKLK